jgi:hypothetical protein
MEYDFDEISFRMMKISDVTYFLKTVLMTLHGSLADWRDFSKVISMVLFNLNLKCMLILD